MDSNVKAIVWEITPETVTMLPRFDVTLLLTVFHHWDRRYGRDDAEEMLRQTGVRTGKLFFEVPKREMDWMDFGDAGVIEGWTEYLESIMNGARVLEAEVTDYKGGQRKDVIFAIDTSERTVMD